MPTTLLPSSWQSPLGLVKSVGRQNSTARLVLGISGTLIAVSLGLLAVVLPWELLFALVLAMLYPVVVFTAPWIAFTVYIVAAFLAPGFKSSDALTLVSLGLFGLRWFLDGRPTVLPRLLTRPYFLFLSSIAASAILGLVIYRHPIPMVYADGRGFIAWLWLPLLYSLAINTRNGIQKLARVFVFVAAMIACVALVQYFTGLQLVAAGRVADLDATSGSVTRVQMHGFLFVSVAIVWALVALIEAPRRALWLLPFMIILLAALYANFGRGLWFWTGLALMLSAFVAGRKRGQAIALVLFFASVFGLAGLSFVKPKVFENIIERVESVRDEGGARTSYGWRKLENSDALPHIFRNPILGLGLGAEYRRWINEVAKFDQHTRYVHNSFIFIALKTGLLSLLSLMAILLTAWWKGWKGTRSEDVPQRALRVAAVASLAPLLGLSITQPELVTPMSVLLFVILTVFMASCEKLAPKTDVEYQFKGKSNYSWTVSREREHS